MNEYQFTNNWFEWAALPVWNDLIPQIRPTRVLEIGSYEGCSTCYLIEKLAAYHDTEIHCVDTWEGGVEHGDEGRVKSDMSEVEKRFHHNIEVAKSKAGGSAPQITLYKSFSDVALSKMLTEGKQGYFDFIYVDGSHQAPDVLCDAVLSFRLLKVNGVIVFDDYLWQETSLSENMDPIRCPKIAIDAFTTIYCRKTKIFKAPLYQMYIKKLSD